MKKLLLAAGGGGDAFTAGVLAQCFENDDTFLASFSWDRIMYDPDPGPRNGDEFISASKYGKYNTIITSESKLKKEGSKSFLPIISEYFQKEYFLMELDKGVIHLHAQLNEIISKESIDEVIIVDVGGDILATGTEKGLKSPIADASVLSACKGLGIPVFVWVTGGGLDGELTEEELTSILDNIKIISKKELPEDLANLHLQAFEWLPSEASALFFMASTGKKGICEIRQDGYSVELNDFASTIFCLDFEDVYLNSTIAREVESTSSLDEIESIVRDITSISELDIERKKRERISAWNDNRTNDELLSELVNISHLKKEAGVKYMTRRRVCELLKVKGSQRDSFIAYLKANHGDLFTPPLWRCE